MLGKMLKLGGIDNSIPQTDQSVGRFRVARNVMPTNDGFIIPRKAQEDLELLPNTVKYISYMCQHNDERLSILLDNTGGSDFLAMWSTESGVATQIPMQVYAMGDKASNLSSYVDNTLSYMSYMRNGTTYFINPTAPIIEEGNTLKKPLFKYDGVEISSMGCPQPKINSADYASTGSKYLRVIQHQLDFDNNEPTSEYVQFRTNAATLMTIETNPSTNLIGSTNVLPLAVIPQAATSGGAGALLGDTNYFVGTATYDAGNVEFDITTADTNITRSTQIGSYVFVSHSLKSAATSGMSIPTLAIALKVKALSPLRLDATGIKVLNTNREWVDGTLATPATLASIIISGYRKVLTVWKGPSEFGNYVFAGSGPAFPESSGSSQIFSVDVTSTTSTVGANDTAFLISPNLGDWYDTTSIKISPNAIYPFGNKRGITNYQDLLIMFTDDLTWFSDTTLGGSYEQLNAINFIKVGDSQFGKVTSACGTSDFMFLGRERKNYYINGVLPTGNYRVVEIEQSEIGPWSNSCSVNVKNTVVYLSSVGVFMIEDGGKSTKLSMRIPENFNNFYTGSAVADVSFQMTGTTATIGGADVGISVAYDQYRELLAFCKKGAQNKNSTLVIDLQNMEFYEWDFIATSPRKAGCIHFQDAKLYVGEYTVGSASCIESEENYAAPLDGATSPIVLYSTWLTAGEPSLEKQALQLKMFGNINKESDTESITVQSFRDWDIDTKITDSDYFPYSTTQYSHKKRLNTDKVLALSCGFQITNTTTFRLEGMEVEFNPIQQGMKK